MGTLLPYSFQMDLLTAWNIAGTLSTRTRVFHIGSIGFCNGKETNRTLKWMYVDACSPFTGLIILISLLPEFPPQNGPRSLFR